MFLRRREFFMLIEVRHLEVCPLRDAEIAFVFGALTDAVRSGEVRSHAGDRKPRFYYFSSDSKKRKGNKTSF